MKDITLMELAAKAAGLTVRRVNDELFWETTDARGEKISFDWNPLRDDGDAFRLLVALGEVVTVDPGKDSAHERARRAIVEAAIRRNR